MKVIEERDYLEEMFECYFRYRKHHSALPAEKLQEAIFGALSGADYPKVVSEDLLGNLISDIDIIKANAEKVLLAKKYMKDTVLAPVTIIPDQPQSDWLDLDEVCSIFKLSKNNIKNKTWRDSNGFPTHQRYKGAKVTFNRKEVEIWLNADKH